MAEPVRFTLRCWNCGEEFSHTAEPEQLSGLTLKCYFCKAECTPNLPPEQEVPTAITKGNTGGMAVSSAGNTMVLETRKPD